MTNKILPLFLLFIFLISCEKGDKLDQQVESEYFTVSLPSNWEIFRTDIEQSSLGLRFYTTSVGLSIESFKDLSIRFNYIYEVLKPDQTALDFWIEREGLENSPQSGLKLEGFDSYLIEKTFSVLDEENAINRDYHKSVWCLVGQEKTYYIEYGSYDRANFERYQPFFKEILGSFKER